MSEQGKTYAAFVEAELKTERERRTIYDTRGQAVVTTSAGLVTLLVALATLVRQGGPKAFPGAAIAPLVVALVALAGAAALGILASWNFRYAVVKSTTLGVMTGAHWTDHEVDARNVVATAQIRSFHSLREANNRKALLLTGALASQLLALVALGAVVLVVVVAA
ncbi:hypothetical protein GCM10010172_87450 [Paractinoplanes ferrugineus]|uniref:Uncharacterized protein n=1 Tax=Paractinoplanes ferrugineus TaxID=113564 RepID=A0A919JA22_9ACTN|nr:hypothetical protein [Actinoplanes ferrugineus]GIE16520.1 hypothetical protein Afe05nite_83600 [Actinoplanes ferrugineus]